MKEEIKLAETIIKWWEENQFNVAGDFNVYDDKPFFVIKAEEILKQYSFNKTDEIMDNPSKEEVLKAINLVDNFLKCMRVEGYFGASPQSQIDLDNQQLMINKNNEIKDFINSKNIKSKKKKNRLVETVFGFFYCLGYKTKSEVIFGISYKLTIIVIIILFYFIKVRQII